MGLGSELPRFGIVVFAILVAEPPGAEAEGSHDTARNHSCHFDHREKSPNAATSPKEISPCGRDDTME
jgi:hypothetical protein